MAEEAKVIFLRDGELEEAVNVVPRDNLTAVKACNEDIQSFQETTSNDLKKVQASKDQEKVGMLSDDLKECELKVDLPLQPAEDMRDGSLLQHQANGIQAWRVGSRCRAIYSEDGLAYSAIILEIKEQRCRVKFDGYGNEEELDLASLLHLGELNGPCGVASGRQATSREKIPSTSSPHWTRRREEGHGERMGQDRHHERRASQQEKLPASHMSPGIQRSGNNSGQEQGDRRQERLQKDALKSPSTNLFSVLSATPPSLIAAQGDHGPFVPPPPPPMFTWPSRAGGGVGRLEIDMASLSSLLVTWYLLGYDTGCSMSVQQSKSNSEGSPGSSE